MRISPTRALAIGLAVVVSFSALSCGGLSGEQKKAVDEAMASLGEVSAATQLGANLQQYSSLVIQAQADVNEAVAKLPAGELS